MALKLLAACLLLPAVFARIEIDIKASTDEKERDVEMFGSNVDLISDVERTTFLLDNESLKNAVMSHFGKRPDDAYLRSPTPWGDLYQTYNWAQVTRTLSPQRAKILSVITEPTIIATKIFNNNSSKTEEFKSKIAEKVQNTVSSFWEKDGELKVGQTINYGFNLKAVSGEMDLIYTSRWGENISKSKSALGSDTEVVVTLEPNQSVMAELYATRATMKIKVDYEATLSGTVAVNYAETYKGHSFWALDIKTVMNSAGLKNSVLSSEVIEIVYFTDSKVVIRDSITNVVLYSVPLNVY